MLPWWLLITLAVVAVGFAIWSAVTAVPGRRWRWFGRAAMALLMLTAMSRPGTRAVAFDTANLELDVVFVVDSSASSGAEDWAGLEPRIDGMRADVAELASRHAGARFALISFDSQAIQRLPFSTDASALGHAMNRLTPEAAMFAQGTSIGAAAELLELVLQGAAEDYPERTRIVYYLGDGEQTASTEPESFAAIAELIQGGEVLGYGTTRGARMRDYSPYAYKDYITDNLGQEGRSKIDVAALEGIADELDVPFQHRNADSTVEAASVDVARGDGAEDRSGTTTFPLYWVPALAALAWMLAEGSFLAADAVELRRARRTVR